eukprot:TRINITY_DN16841_c0_g1_i1.p1 TRINITY_DN16841_c0_g1~~TRINITY_DN16841_c0_g1_i1.p1  ORF type:complete len:264 (+),score=43.43 TRINITY_DN16841_c0_g1_i1:81-872(+)
MLRGEEAQELLRLVRKHDMDINQYVKLAREYSLKPDDAMRLYRWMEPRKYATTRSDDLEAAFHSLKRWRMVDTPSLMPLNDEHNSRHFTARPGRMHAKLDPLRRRSMVERKHYKRQQALATLKGWMQPGAECGSAEMWHDPPGPFPTLLGYMHQIRNSVGLADDLEAYEAHSAFMDTPPPQTAKQAAAHGSSGGSSSGSSGSRRSTSVPSLIRDTGAALLCRVTTLRRTLSVPSLRSSAKVHNTVEKQKPAATRQRSSKLRCS